MLYEYEGLLALLKRMIWFARCDVLQENGEDAHSAYLFLYWIDKELVPYLEDIGRD